MVSEQLLTYHALCEAGLERVANHLVILVQDAAQLVVQPSATTVLPLGTSRIGGTPDLLPTQTWPTWNNAPLGFVAQIALADVQQLPIAKQLPATGLLLFFCDSQQRADGSDAAAREAWRMLYAADTNGLQPTTAPPQLPLLPVHTLSFMATQTLPDVAGLPKSIRLNAKETAHYEAVLHELRSGQTPTQPHHHLLGWPEALQDDVLETCSSASGLPGRWQLLLQLDSDEAAGMRWSSAGMLYFAVPMADLRAAKFDNGWAVLQAD